MAKRKVEEIENAVTTEEPRRSSRRKPNAKQEEAEFVDTKPATKTKREAAKKKQIQKVEESNSSQPPASAVRDFDSIKDRDLGLAQGEEYVLSYLGSVALYLHLTFLVRCAYRLMFAVFKNSAKPIKSAESNSTNSSSTESPARQYWLMKAEPESRLEKGHDIKFSIDDLEAKTEPEPWDGIRAYPARNNIRAMKKGDLAFFYHSSCKVPAIVGIMEIVQEHTPDLSAHDPKAPYYDPRSSPDDPKWSVVHVEFRQKLKTPITLKELKAWFNEKGHPLENMQMLKLARLSVSKISDGEWRFIVGEMEKNGDVLNVV